MSGKSELYAEFKRRGGEPGKHYREYTIPELQDLIGQLPAPAPAPDAPAPAPAHPPAAPAAPADSQRFLHPDVIRVDEQGRQWIQEEVRKPAYPKPRGRRVLTYVDTGVKQETVQSGEYIETYEVAGNRDSRTSEIKITLPSFQTGIYMDPRFPMFRVHIYNDQQGFDFEDVNRYYGGAELVPEMVKRIYISSDLCYDQQSVIRAIQAEYRQMQLSGGIK